MGSSGSGKGAVAVIGKKPLTSGIYLAGRHLAMGGLGSLGGHQFVVLIPKEASAFSDATDLNATTKGFTLGAYNENGRLQYSPNAPSDVGAMKSYLSGDEKGSLGLEVVSVYLSKTGKSVDEAIKALVMAANRYQDEERKRPIYYPDDVFGQFAKGCLNSNSWAQSLIEHTFGKGEVKEDMPGIDTCKVSRIDAAYFTTTASKYPVTKPTTTPEPKKAVAAKKTPKTYVVCVGDTLAGIAHKVYGNAKKWEAIYAANKGQIANPNLIRPGQKLVIPVDATY